MSMPFPLNRTTLQKMTSHIEIIKSMDWRSAFAAHETFSEFFTYGLFCKIWAADDVKLVDSSPETWCENNWERHSINSIQNFLELNSKAKKLFLHSQSIVSNKKFFDSFSVQVTSYLEKL